MIQRFSGSRSGSSRVLERRSPRRGTRAGSRARRRPWRCCPVDLVDRRARSVASDRSARRVRDPLERARRRARTRLAVLGARPIALDEVLVGVRRMELHQPHVAGLDPPGSRRACARRRSCRCRRAVEDHLALALEEARDPPDVLSAEEELIGERVQRLQPLFVLVQAIVRGHRGGPIEGSDLGSMGDRSETVRRVRSARWRAGAAARSEPPGSPAPRGSPTSRDAGGRRGGRRPSIQLHRRDPSDVQLVPSG